MKLSDYVSERKDRITPDDADLDYEKVNKISFSGEVHISTSRKSKTKMILVEPYDFLVSGINASKGAISINQTGRTLVATIHYSSYLIDLSKVDLQFFSILIKSESFISKLRDMVKGGIKTELKPKKILDMDITLPPISVQKKIVEDYQRQKELLYNDYFLAFDSKYIRRIKEQLYDQVLFNGKSIDPSNANADTLFRNVSLFDLLVGKPKNGYSPKPVVSETNNKVLSLSATTSEEFRPSEFKYFNEDVSDELVVKIGDVFVQRGNSRDYVGVTAACLVEPTDKIIYPDLMMRLRTTEEILPQYLVYYLNSGNVRRYFRHKAKGTVDTMVKINQDTLRSLYISLPDITTQQQIVAKIRKIRVELDTLDSSIQLVKSKTTSVIEAYFVDRLAKATKERGYYENKEN